MLIIYVLAIFVSALLLFIVEPMFARMILPLLDGSPSVWSTASPIACRYRSGASTNHRFPTCSKNPSRRRSSSALLIASRS